MMMILHFPNANHCQVFCGVCHQDDGPGDSGNDCLIPNLCARLLLTALVLLKAESRLVEAVAGNTLPHSVANVSVFYPRQSPIERSARRATSPHG